MASDGRTETPAPRKRATDSAFRWVSSSPTPAEVARLEKRFPEVVHVPASLLEEEIGGWLKYAVIVRSFIRWVPADAFIREFRRAGIAGGIDHVSLASRCHIFRFEDPEAAALVLSRPWVINGQIIGSEAWHPEFFPVVDSVATAMIWMRMPNLPVEFWKEEFLRAISEPAGSFSGADSATQARNRGGYARVAIRVDLRLPLRPGTRIQGLQGPFWQPFVYESLEGVCPNCGSLHLVDPCSEAATEGADELSGSSVFGPWMTAVRQRRELPRSQPLSPPVGSVSSRASHHSAEVPGDEGGWNVQSHQRRRRPLVSTKIAQANSMDSLKQGADPASVSGVQQKFKGKGVELQDSLVAVPVKTVRAGFKPPSQGQDQANKDVVSDPQFPISANPFAMLGSVQSVGSIQDLNHQSSGPLKRARPAEGIPPRINPKSSKSSKSQGKGKGKQVNCRVDFIPSLSCLSQPLGCQVAGPEGSKGNPEKQADQSGEVTVDDSERLTSVVYEVEQDVMKDCPPQFFEDGSQSGGCQGDSVMAEDPGGGSATSN